MRHGNQPMNYFPTKSLNIYDVWCKTLQII